MKTETAASKLAKLLGIEEKVEEIKVKQSERNGIFQGVTEDEIQHFRAAQGLVYFLQAPELFQLKYCKHCGAEFLVSRLYVALCSYTCIAKSLEEMGILWRKGKDFDLAIEETIKEVYGGNEPLWIRNVEQLRNILLRLNVSSISQDLKPQPTTAPPSLPPTNSDSQPSTQTTSPKVIKRSKSKRQFT